MCTYLRDRLAHSMQMDSDQIHFISPDVGGAFGLKFFLQCETVVAAHAARDIRTDRSNGWPIRNESFLSDLHGRDHVTNGCSRIE